MLGFLRFFPKKNSSSPLPAALAAPAAQATPLGFFKSAYLMTFTTKPQKNKNKTLNKD
jgi:hypothetical protein